MSAKVQSLSLHLQSYCIPIVESWIVEKNCSEHIKSAPAGGGQYKY